MTYSINQGINDLKDCEKIVRARLFKTSLNSQVEYYLQTNRFLTKLQKGIKNCTSK